MSAKCKKQTFRDFRAISVLPIDSWYESNRLVWGIVYCLVCPAADGSLSWLLCSLIWLLCIFWAAGGLGVVMTREPPGPFGHPLHRALSSSCNLG
jgi:hypothetical protein